MRYLFVLTICVIFLWSICDCKSATRLKRLQRRCRAANHRYYDANNNRCKRCPKCAVGRGLIHNYQDIRKHRRTNLPLTCYKCFPCKAGYYSDHRDYVLCRPCYNCTLLGRLDLTVCETSVNTKCGECQPGFHDVYKKKTGVEDTTKHCQACEHAEEDVADCLTNVHSLPLKGFTSMATPAEGWIGPTKMHGFTTPVPTPKNQFSNNESQKQQRDFNSQEGTKLILLEKLTTHSIPDMPHRNHEGQTWTDGALQTIAWGGGFLVALVTFVIPVTIWFVTRRITQTENNIPSTADPQGGTASPNTDQQRQLLPNRLDTDVEPDSCSLGVTTPLVNRRQQGLPAVHYKKKKKSSVSHQPTTGQTSIGFPDKHLSVGQKYLLRRMGGDWADLGRALGLNDAYIDCLREDYSGNRNEQIYQMMIGLERSYPERATVGNVYSALQTLNKDTLSREFLETIKMSEHQLRTPASIQ